MSIEYLVQRSAKTGEVIDLGRIIEDDTGVRGELWLLDRWVPSESMVDIIFNPLAGDWIEDSEVDAYKREVEARHRRLADEWEQKKKRK